MFRLASLCISVLLVCLLACGGQLPTPAPQKPTTDPLPFTPGELQDIYKSYNSQYWDGKLAKATVVWTVLKVGRFGETEKEDDGRFLIRLDSTKNREANVAKTTILHEMCHVRTWGEDCHIPGTPNKCRRWLAELHRIMLEGAFDDLV
jgi:hypothetical protein